MNKSQTGIPGGEFLPCPDSPNCVSSMAEDKSHFIEPLKYEGMSGEDAFQRILTILEAEPRCRVITAEEDSPAYIHAEYRSRIFRFVDDVEFLLVPKDQLIHVKSASRLGYSDMGVNRKRVEHLRAKINGN